MKIGKRLQPVKIEDVGEQAGFDVRPGAPDSCGNLELDLRFAIFKMSIQRTNERMQWGRLPENLPPQRGGLSPTVALGAEVDFLYQSLFGNSQTSLSIGPRLAYFFSGGEERLQIKGSFYPYIAGLMTIGFSHKPFWRSTTARGTGSSDFNRALQQTCDGSSGRSSATAK